MPRRFPQGDFLTLTRGRLDGTDWHAVLDGVKTFEGLKDAAATSVLTLKPDALKRAIEQHHENVRLAESTYQRYKINDADMLKWLDDMQGVTVKATTTHREASIVALMIKHHNDLAVLTSKMNSQMSEAKKNSPLPAVAAQLHKVILDMMQKAKKHMRLV